MDEMDGRAASLDDVDLELLACVEDDFDVNLEELSDELGLSKSAVHYRLSKLRDNGVIDGVSADVDPLALGLNMAMITEITVTHERGYAEDIGTALTDVPGVTHVYYTMGDVDFVALSRVQDRDQMNALIDDIIAIDGVDETASRFVMDELKTDDRAVANLSDAMRNRVLDAE